MKPSLKRKLNKAIKETKDFVSGKTPPDYSLKFGHNICVFCGKGNGIGRPHKWCLDKALQE